MGGCNHLSTDLTAFYNRPENDTSMSVQAYYNQPDPAPQGNRRQRRALAAQKRRKKT